MSRTRVAHVIDSLADSGGAERRLVEEVLALGDRFDQLVVRCYERAELEPRLVAGGVEVRALGLTARRAARTFPFAARRLRSVLRAWRPDVVHTSLFNGNLVGQLAARPLGIPVVSEFNRTGDVDLQRALQPGVWSWRGRAVHAVARWASRSGNVSFRAVGADAAATNAARFGVPSSAVTVVPRGIAVAAVAPRTRAELGLPEGPLVANVARLVAEKGQALLVEAFRHVRVALPQAQLIVAGATGPAVTDVRAAVRRHGLGPAVHLLGHRSDALEVMAAADVVVLSSLSEGSPSVVLEAMSVGTPVVAFDIPPVRELTDDGRCAVLAPAGDAAALGSALVDALGHRDEERVSTARAWAAGFDLTRTAAALGDLLEQRARHPWPASVGRPATEEVAGG